MSLPPFPGTNVNSPKYIFGDALIYYFSKIYNPITVTLRLGLLVAFSTLLLIYLFFKTNSIFIIFLENSYVINF